MPDGYNPLGPGFHQNVWATDGSALHEAGFLQPGQMGAQLAENMHDPQWWFSEITDTLIDAIRSVYTEIYGGLGAMLGTLVNQMAQTQTPDAWMEPPLQLLNVETAMFVDNSAWQWNMTITKNRDLNNCGSYLGYVRYDTDSPRELDYTLKNCAFGQAIPPSHISLPQSEIRGVPKAYRHHGRHSRRNGPRAGDWIGLSG